MGAILGTGPQLKPLGGAGDGLGLELGVFFKGTALECFLTARLEGKESDAAGDSSKEGNDGRSQGLEDGPVASSFTGVWKTVGTASLAVVADVFKMGSRRVVNSTFFNLAALRSALRAAAVVTAT